MPWLIIHVASDHTCKTNEPSILFSIDWRGGRFKGENNSLTLEAGAGLNS